MQTLLTVDQLRIEFPRGKHAVASPVDGVSFTIDRGETFALVGESGSGKSLTSLALLQLIPEPGRIAAGSRIALDGQPLIGMTEAQLRAIRGGRIGMVFQDPMNSLNPVLTVGSQVAEAITAHESIGSRAARDRAVKLLEEVGVPDPAGRFRAYPHQLSGGQRQRVMIAIALAASPDLLVADEPTTALDVTVQAQILELLDRLKASRGMAILLISHDLGIVAGRADRVAVMYAGQIVEQARTRDLFQAPSHPYTRALLDAIPRLDGPIDRLRPIQGSVPNPDQWPSGCRFHPRCAEVLPRCPTDVPPWFDARPEQHARCWLLAEPPA